MVFCLVLSLLALAAAPWSPVAAVAPIPIEAAALRAIFTATNAGGTSWLDTEGWDSDDTLCEAFGITCEQRNSAMRVVEVDMTSNGLVGVVPAELGNLVLIRKLVFYNNSITALPNTLDRLEELTYFSMDINQLSRLPVLPRALQYLFCTDNKVEEVTGIFALNPPIIRINLDQNLLTKIRAEDFCHLVALDEIYLQENMIALLPDCFFTLPLLRNVRLTANQLVTVPKTAETAPAIEVFDIAKNNMKGFVPCIKHATTMYLQNNDLEDNNSPNCLPSLVTINVAMNKNLETLNCIAAAAQTLKSLDVSNTRVNARNLMTTLSSFRALFSLTAVNANFDVTVPEFFSNLVNIRTLGIVDISHNPGMGGSIQELDFTQIGYDYLLFNFPSMISISLRNTSILILDEYQYENFPNLRDWDLQDNPSLVAAPTLFNFLIKMDVRGGPKSVLPADPAVPFYPSVEDRDVVDNTFHARCPSGIVTGAFNTFRMIVTPSQLEYRFCECLPGFFGNPFTDKASCLQCPQVPEIECKQGVLSAATDGVGVWPVYHSKTDEFTVVPCPADSGSHPCRNLRIESVEQIKNPENLQATVTCADGYQGRLCSECAEGYFRSGRRCRTCRGKFYTVSPVITVCLLFFIGLRTLRSRGSPQLNANAAAAALGAAALPPPIKAGRGLFRIIINHAQLYASLPLRSVTLPAPVLGLLKVFESSTSIIIDGVECWTESYDGFYSPFIYALMSPGPLILLALVVAIGDMVLTSITNSRRRRNLEYAMAAAPPAATLVHRVFSHSSIQQQQQQQEMMMMETHPAVAVRSASFLTMPPPPHQAGAAVSPAPPSPSLAGVGAAGPAIIPNMNSPHQRVLQLLTQSMLVLSILWTVVIFGITRRLFAAVNCTGYGDTEGHKWVSEAMWIKCDTSAGTKYLTYFVLAIIFGLFYLIITATLMTVTLIPRFYRFLPRMLEPFRDEIMIPYREETAYWEMISLARRVIISLIQSLVPYGSFFLPLLLSIVLVIGLALQSWKHPYRHRFNNSAENTSLTILFATFLMSFASSSTTEVRVISVFLFACNVIFIGICVLVMLIEMIKRPKWIEKSEPLTATELRRAFSASSVFSTPVVDEAGLALPARASYAKSGISIASLERSMVHPAPAYRAHSNLSILSMSMNGEQPPHHHPHHPHHHHQLPGAIQ